MKNKKVSKKQFSSLGDYLKEKRESTSYTQSYVAKSCQCKAQFVSNWERGLCSPPWPILKKLIKIYDLPQKQLFLFLMKEHEKLIKTELGINKK